VRLLVAMLALSFVVAGSAYAAAPTASAPKTMVITVKSVTSSVGADDKPPKGYSKGDHYLIRDRLLNVAKQFGKPAGAVVGRDQGVWTLTSAKAGPVVGFATLPGGTIRFQGVLEAAGVSARFKVTGGTGTYAHAVGVLVIGPGNTPLNTYRITLGTMTAITPVI
jgi:hypothetical protein